MAHARAHSVGLLGGGRGVEVGYAAPEPVASLKGELCYTLDACVRAEASVQLRVRKQAHTWPCGSASAHRSTKPRSPGCARGHERGVMPCSPPSHAPLADPREQQEASDLFCASSK